MSSPSVSKVSRVPRLLRSKGSKNLGMVFTAPAILWLIAFCLFPMVFGLVISFFNYNPLTTPVFNGLSNYIGIFKDQAFRDSLLGTAIYVFGTVIPVWAFSLGIALILSKTLKFGGLWKVLLFLPTVIPTISISLIWIPLLNDSGPINHLLNSLNLPSVSWLTSPEAAPWAMIVLSWWHATSYYIFIFLAGLLAIPKMYYEAATLDGAGSWSQFRHITIPLLKRSITLVIVMSIINAMQTFVFQSVITGGGPGNSTEILTLLIYRTGFEYQDMGRAAAMSVVLFSLILLFSLFQLKLFREE